MTLGRACGFGLSMVVAAAATWLGATGCLRETGTATEPLVVYVAAGLKVPMEAARADYERETGRRVQLQFGGSNTLLANMAMSGAGDVFIPADESYVGMARRRGLVAESMAVATMKPVLAVRVGNPKGIGTLQDLLDGKARLAQANPDAAAIGAVVRDALMPLGKWDAVKERTTVFKPTVSEVATDVSVGAVDAAFVFDITVKQFKELEAIVLPELAGREARVTAAIVKGSKQPTAALKFARFVAARDRGLRYFSDAGFTVVAGDEWAEAPDLHLLSGAMLRPAIEETIQKFETREGVRVTRVYNGCGILVGQMKAGEHPDAYFACETSFMKQVSDLFQTSEDISSNQLVIVVPRGNPKHIKTLRDLTAPGLKVGVGHEQQCALGALTRETLIQSKMYDSVRKNVVVETPAGDMLVNQLMAGSLDAVLAYISNTAANQDKLEAFTISIPCAYPSQPIAIGRESRYKHLMSRLVESIKTEDSRQVFLSQGFTWKATRAATTQQ